MEKFTLYEPYGLNKYKNFLVKKSFDEGYVFLDDIEELFSFSYAMLSEHNCSSSAIFAIDADGAQWAIIYSPDDEEEPIKVFSPTESYMDFFAEWDAELRLCCYSLLVERRPGMWEII